MAVEIASIRAHLHEFHNTEINVGWVLILSARLTITEK